MDRRQFVQTAGGVALSASAVAILGGQEALARDAKGGSPKNDIGILNVALGLEHEGIFAYGAGAKLLSPETLKVAVSFMDNHKEHRDALMATIKKLGGSPVAPKSDSEYATALNAASLKNESDVLNLALKLEKGAANAYIGVIPSFNEIGLAKVAARLAADEVMHWTILNSALKLELPKNAMSFGA